MEPDYLYSISEFTRLAKNLLEQTIGHIWVEGEISNLAMPRSGHWYFTLKDEYSQIRCAMFRPTKTKCPFEPEEGLTVKAFAKPSIYPDRGDFQLIVERMEESGEGALKKAFEKLKKQLEAKGLFDLEHKKLLPEWPKKIGVITSSTGAAIHDILTVLKRRFPAIPVIIYPTSVQGIKAHLEIINALTLANKHNVADVLILARGGGSLEDLWPFNEEDLAHAIFASKIPLVSGVGHETDMTIADLVADQRAPTPSAAAELVSPDKNEIGRLLQDLLNQLIDTIEDKLDYFTQKIDFLGKRLKHPKQRITHMQEKNQHLARLLIQFIKHKLDQKQAKLNTLATTLDALSPLATLKRGFSLTLKPKTKQIITSTKQVKLGDSVQVKLNEGALLCTVEALEE